MAGAGALVALACAGAGFADSNSGIDVSHWNRVQSWRSVAAAGYGYAFVKATDGAAGVDATYWRYRAGATAAGLRVGAYHFARPAGRTRAAQAADARAEADHFAAVAQPRPGELRPVLDLEHSGGLRPGALIAWTSTWLQEVERDLHVKPAIYASPYFWRVAMADTTLFAARGHMLWLARWTRAPAPVVPGLNWAGFGWTFWQWTSCGRVPGIRGCVDLDRFNGASLTLALVGAAPSHVTLPAIAGTPQVGQSLAATTGSWRGTSPIRFTYAWERCDLLGASCIPIAGANAAAYTVTTADAGYRLTVVVTAKNRVGATPASALPTAVVS
ncbi:MAG TPA: GH25 family lysozyme [Gaiellaceae bacterium]|jgi:GH25 family lysozyme M1 (1,4-beta-N-acetylmuramidase)|nr:GH25 family lysozyme [Gaiellaceae bacterium]